MNKVELCGRLTNDPEVRYSQGEKSTAIARYTLAVDRRFKQDGQPTADFITCVAFGKNGEFAEKYESKDLKLISKIEKEGIFAQLDSKKMWRVLENIYNNAYKHSLEGTRIYVNVEQNDKIVFTMKNISKEELNITPEELMERFVRGDKSRTSGGNGLRSFNS